MRRRKSSVEPSTAIASILVPPRSMPIRMELKHALCSLLSARRSLLSALLRRLPKESIEVQRVCHRERDVALGVARPLRLGTIARQLDAVAIEVCQVDRLADAVIGDALDPHARIDDAMNRAREISPCGIEDGEMVEARVMRGSGSAASALPCVQADVMMVPTGRDERGVIAEPHDLIEPEHTGVKRDRALDVGDL